MGFFVSVRPVACAIAESCVVSVSSFRTAGYLTILTRWVDSRAHPVCACGVAIP
jgi:hypothetical protein